jgi:acetoin utilization protein AcuB
MTKHPIMIAPETPATEAQQIMGENRVRHLPVVGDGKRLLGLITRQRLTLEPDMLGSLDIWEISRYMSNLKVQKVMLPAREVHTITSNKTIERAARELEEHKIGCLPVVGNDNEVVGIISEVDLLHAFQTMLGLPADGVRVTVKMKDEMGQFNKLMMVLAQNNWGVMGIGTFPVAKEENAYATVIKISRVTVEEVEEKLKELPDHQIVDIRTVV